jgi:hypothetical protein
LVAQQGVSLIKRSQVMSNREDFPVRLQGRHDGLEICLELLRMDYPVALEDRYPDILYPGWCEEVTDDRE